MKILNEKLSVADLKGMAANGLGDMVKGVVDISRGLLALDAELQAELEALLLKEGSKQLDLWGINLYPEVSGGDFVEFDSMINIRPSIGNRSRGVENEEIRKKILQIVDNWVTR